MSKFKVWFVFDGAYRDGICFSDGKRRLSRPVGVLEKLKIKNIFIWDYFNRPLAKPAQIMYTIEYESRNNTRIFG